MKIHFRLRCRCLAWIQTCFLFLFDSNNESNFSPSEQIFLSLVKDDTNKYTNHCFRKFMLNPFFLFPIFRFYFSTCCFPSGNRAIMALENFLSRIALFSFLPFAKAPPQIRHQFTRGRQVNSLLHSYLSYLQYTPLCFPRSSSLCIVKANGN